MYEITKEGSRWYVAGRPFRLKRDAVAQAEALRADDAKRAANALYIARKNRTAHPDGKCDGGGRWYPSEAETCDCCAYIRAPSRSFPWSYMRHCRTKQHCAALVAKGGAA